MTLKCFNLVKLNIKEDAKLQNKNMIDIENHKQLFIDKRFIQDSENVNLTMNPPYMAEDPILIADRPWEVHIGSKNTLIKENALFPNS